MTTIGYSHNQHFAEWLARCNFHLDRAQMWSDKSFPIGMALIWGLAIVFAFVKSVIILYFTPLIVFLWLLFTEHKWRSHLRKADYAVNRMNEIVKEERP